jgi:hypothetical protein
MVAGYGYIKQDVIKGTLSLMIMASIIDKLFEPDSN